MALKRRIKTAYYRLSIGFVTGCIIFFNSGPWLQAQNSQTVLADSATVDDCIKYAMQHQPLIRQLKIDEDISRQNIRIALSDWLPQINSNAGVQHYLKQPVFLFPNVSNPSGPKILIPNGVLYNSSIQFSASQNIFNSDVYLAGRTAGNYRLQSTQTTTSALIEMVVDINKAFYDVLLSREQLNVIIEEISRLTKSLKDAYALYQNGTTDMIDYKRATIALNNALAQKKSAQESVWAKLSYLKRLIGYPPDKPLNLNANLVSIGKELLLDTIQRPNINNRIEYQLLQTNLKLQKAKTDYYKMSFLPTLSAFANYNLIYQNDAWSELYKRSFPNSTIGLSLSFPIMQGTKRMQNIKKSKLQYERLTLDTLNFRNEMSTEFVSAMATYKSDLASYLMTLRNIEIANEVYNTVKLQYNQGVKTYLEVIVSETDLMSARINNLNALFMLMFSKLDVQRATGSITVNY
jgi:outer membrane protein